MNHADAARVMKLAELRAEMMEALAIHDALDRAYRGGLSIFHAWKAAGVLVERAAEAWARETLPFDELYPPAAVDPPA